MLLFPLVGQLTGFGQVYNLIMLQHILLRYEKIDGIDLEENAIKIMGTYDPAETLYQLIEELEKGREFTVAGEHTIANLMIFQKLSPF